MRFYFTKTHGTSKEAIRLLNRIFKDGESFVVIREHEDDFASSISDKRITNRRGLASEWEKLYYECGFTFEHKATFDRGKEIWFKFIRDNQIYWYIINKEN